MLILGAGLGCNSDSSPPKLDPADVPRQTTALRPTLVEDNSNLLHTNRVTAHGRALIEDDTLVGVVYTTAEDLNSGTICTEEFALAGVPTARCPDCDFGFDLSTTTVVSNDCPRHPVLSLTGGDRASIRYAAPGIGWIGNTRTTTPTTDGELVTETTDMLVGIFDVSYLASVDYGYGYGSYESTPETRLLKLSYSELWTLYSTDGDADTGMADTAAPEVSDPVVVTEVHVGQADILGDAWSWTLETTLTTEDQYEWCDPSSQQLDMLGYAYGYGYYESVGSAAIRERFPSLSGQHAGLPTTPFAVDPSAQVTSTLPCAGGLVDIWTVDVEAGDRLAMLVDTITPDTAFDPALYVSTEDACLLTSGDDELECSWPPPTYACPSAVVTVETTGKLQILVQSLGACTGAQAQYRLAVEKR